MTEPLGALTLTRGYTGAWVLLPSDELDRYMDELQELDAVTTIGGLRSFLAQGPDIGDYAGGPGGALEEIDDERESCDPGTWHDEGLSDESPWSSDSLGQGDYPWPPMLESLGQERLDEDLVDELLDRGLAEYEEVGGPLDWLTIPDEKRDAAVACAESLGYEVVVR